MIALQRMWQSILPYNTGRAAFILHFAPLHRYASPSSHVPESHVGLVDVYVEMWMRVRSRIADFGMNTTVPQVAVRTSLGRVLVESPELDKFVC
jgi:hypothetical protein